MVVRKPLPLDREQWDGGSEAPTSGLGDAGLSTLLWWSGILCFFVVWNQVTASLQRGDSASSANLGPRLGYGVPQIEVTFEIDANGIPNVSAVKKSTEKENKITITNDKGHLSKEDIEHMVQEAEKYKAENEKQRDKVFSRNLLESYAFNMEAGVEDEKLQGKINDENKQKILDKCNEIINWLDKNQTAEKEESEHQQKELEKVCNPIINKLYQSAGDMPGGMSGGFPGRGAPPSDGASSEPTIEEVD
ncbi:Heat shock cognate 71 kDa protein [Heterocephalus glaber]|uniref:Heat shock cognate 71 kDa protein n=1 Tax=Heterocephalus glaber TaxID=10181 RepID=G5APB1_HETGA|nr:Heat shock cognate 71 kDa protein [Heterocephalus glaber]